MVEIVTTQEFPEQRSRIDEIATLLLDLTYGEMTELADAIWQAQFGGLAITHANLAALLHRWSTAHLYGPIDHCGASKKLSSDTFSAKIADFVAVEREAHKSSDRAKVLECVDKTRNLRALLSSPAPDWSVQHKLEYIKWAREVFEGLRGTNATLEKQFDEAVQVAERSLLRKRPRA